MIHREWLIGPLQTLGVDDVFIGEGREVLRVRHTVTVKVGEHYPFIVDPSLVEILHELARRKASIGRFTLHLVTRYDVGRHEKITEDSIKFILEVLHFGETSLRILALFGREEDDHLLLGEIVFSERLDRRLDDISWLTSGREEHHMDDVTPVHDLILDWDELTRLTADFLQSANFFFDGVTLAQMPQWYLTKRVIHLHRARLEHLAIRLGMSDILTALPPVDALAFCHVIIPRHRKDGDIERFVDPVDIKHDDEDRGPYREEKRQS